MESKVKFVCVNCGWVGSFGELKLDEMFKQFYLCPKCGGDQFEVSAVKRLKQNDYEDCAEKRQRPHRY